MRSYDTKNGKSTKSESEQHAAEIQMERGTDLDLVVDLLYFIHPWVGLPVM